MMNLNDSICKFIENARDKSESGPNDKIEMQPEEAQAEKSSFELNPREGMSLETIFIENFHPTQEVAQQSRRL